MLYTECYLQEVLSDLQLEVDRRKRLEEEMEYMTAAANDSKQVNYDHYH